MHSTYKTVYCNRAKSHVFHCWQVAFDVIFASQWSMLPKPMNKINHIVDINLPLASPICIQSNFLLIPSQPFKAWPTLICLLGSYLQGILLSLSVFTSGKPSKMIKRWVFLYLYLCFALRPVRLWIREPLLPLNLERTMRFESRTPRTPAGVICNPQPGIYSEA